MKKKALSFLFLFFVLTSAFCGIMERPRKVYVINTEYFEILFSEKSTYTAQLLSKNADYLYELAQNNIQVENNRKISVIISPDSDEFSVTYTPRPYNRIVIYEAVPEFADSYFEEILLSSFYNELIHQVFQSSRGPIESLISKAIKSDNIQPVYLENMPFSLLEGIQFIEEQTNLFNKDYKINQGHYNDGFFLQILSQSKLENRFPTFPQVLGAMDIYPGTEIANACGSAFCAYLQNRWGVEKFYEFCVNCGSFNLYSTEGVFFQTYGISINEVWSDFEESIPLPEDLENIHKLEKESTEILPNENKGLYEHLLYSPYGIIWYDKIRHEVALYKPENNYLDLVANSGLAGRKLLFLADDITNLSISSEGRFLAVSFKKKGFRENLKKNATWIYDLKTQIFIDEHLPLRDSCIIKFEDGNYGIAGFYDYNNYASIQIYSSGKINQLIQKEKNSTSVKKFSTKLIEEKSFMPDSVPFSFVYTDKGNLYSILNHKTEQFIYHWNFYNNTDEFYTLQNDSSIRIRNLSINQNPYQINQSANSILTFEYVIPKVTDNINFSRFGFIFLNKDFTLEQTWLCKNNVSGGMNYAILKNDDLYYSSIKYDYGEIRKLKLNLLNFENHEISKAISPDPFLKNKDLFIHDRKNFQGELNAYRKISEIIKGSIVPFMPIKEISVEDEFELWPGLGLTFKSYSDKYANNQLFVSGGLGFADLTYEKYTNPTDDILDNLEQEEFERKHDYSAALLYKNTSTAADIFTGTIYKATKEGDYNFKGLIGATLAVPLGMKFRNLKFNAQSDFTASTNFRDPTFSEYYSSLPSKTHINNAYQNVLFSSKIEYSNIHQFGFSPYELRGFSAAIFTNIFWDMELTAINIKNEILQQRINQFANNTFINPSQINIGFCASAKIPQLSFLKDYNNLILCFPTSIDFELFKNNGTAMKVKTETLLFGKEIQNGFNFLHLYFSRFGLKFAYDFGLIYDETKVAPPDLRDFSKFYYSFVNTTINDSVSVTAQLDFIPAIGFLSSALLHTDFILEYYLKTQTSKFSVSLKLNY